MRLSKQLRQITWLWMPFCGQVIFAGFGLVHEQNPRFTLTDIDAA